MADIMTPALGESVTEATVARWTKKVGEAVKKDEILIELETDKVSLEVAAPADGVLSAIGAEEGATVVPGTVLGVVTKAPAPRQRPLPPRRPRRPLLRPRPPHRPRLPRLSPPLLRLPPRLHRSARPRPASPPRTTSTCRRSPVRARTAA
jgi:2-oxoglutarate dehydrogenase E2 component (dihydrolipoamide succinyltransferase)